MCCIPAWLQFVYLSKDQNKNSNEKQPSLFILSQTALISYINQRARSKTTPATISDGISHT